MNVRRLVVPLVAAGIAMALWQLTTKVPAPIAGVPACTWRVGLGTEIRQGVSFDSLPAESPLRLSCWCDEPRFVYVFSHSAEDGTLLLWPSPRVQSNLSQPLPASTNVLPGAFEGKEVAWTTRSGIHAVTTYIVVVARERQAELEKLMPRLRLWSNTVFPDHSMQVTKPATTMELLGTPGSTTFPSPLLERAAAPRGDDTMPNGPLRADAEVPGVWSGCWRVVEKKA